MSEDSSNLAHAMTTILPAVTPASSAGNLPAAVLPIGTRLGEFEITGMVGEGGFGVVYLADDHQLGRQVAVKEYMPSSMATRNVDGSVSVRSEKNTETFATGLRSFVNEARLLAKFDHPALVKVFRFWEANGTAYMVMPYYDGKTLKEVLASAQEPPGEEWLKQLLVPIVDALQTIHADQCYHRDIAPDNIIVLPSGQPLLLDFGAARRVIGDMTQALTVMLKPGYAPVEQYADGPEMKQGPWTDVYALAAVIYFAATGQALVPSVSRMVNDSLPKFSEQTHGAFSDAFASAVDRGLAVRAEDRPQTMLEFAQELGLPGPVESAGVTHMLPGGASVSPSASIPDGWDAPAGEDPDKTVLYVPPPQPATNPLPDAAQASGLTASPPAPDDIIPESSPRPATRGTGQGSTPGTKPPGLPLLPIALVLLAVAGGAAYLTLGSDQSAEPTDMTQIIPVPPAAPTAKNPPVNAALPAQPAPTAKPNPPVQPSPPIAAAPPAIELEPPTQPVPPTAPVKADFSVGTVINAVFAGRSADWPVTAEPTASRLKIGQDLLRIKIASQREGYLYLLMRGSDPTQFYLIFPNELDTDNLLRAGQAITIPRGDSELVATGPPGVSRLLAIVSPGPRDFKQAGAEPMPPFKAFDIAVAQTAYESQGTSVFAGIPGDCAGGSGQCQQYGAAQVDIEEHR